MVEKYTSRREQSLAVPKMSLVLLGLACTTASPSNVLPSNRPSTTPAASAAASSASAIHVPSGSGTCLPASVNPPGRSALASDAAPATAPREATKLIAGTSPGNSQAISLPKYSALWVIDCQAATVAPM